MIQDRSFLPDPSIVSDIELRGRAFAEMLAERRTNPWPGPVPEPCIAGRLAVLGRGRSAPPRVPVEGGRIGVVVNSGRVGIKVWNRIDEYGWTEQTIWVEGNNAHPALIYARCLLAVDGQFFASTNPDGSFSCELTEITRLTGFPDESFRWEAFGVWDQSRLAATGQLYSA